MLHLILRFYFLKNCLNLITAILKHGIPAMTRYDNMTEVDIADLIMTFIEIKMGCVQLFFSEMSHFHPVIKIM